MLRELSKSYPDLWIRISDSDGEFLLIEAAKVLPKWLSPEMDSNRVWIHDGKLRIVPLSTDTGSGGSKSISLREALEVIRAAPGSLVYSTFVDAEAFYRLEKYPGQITNFLHHSMVTLPRKLAYILHQRPKAIAPAAEALYLRDPIAMKPLLSPSTLLLFPPADLVTISICFTKVIYAQLKSQRLEPPPAWRSMLQSAEVDAVTGTNQGLQKFARLEMGMRLTTGFEMPMKAAAA
jgi:SGT1 protein